MGGAGKARIEGANRDFNIIEQTLGELVAVQILQRNPAYRFVHRLVIMRCGNNQICAHDLLIFVDLVMVDQRAARRFDHPDTLQLPFTRTREIVAEQISILQQFLYRLSGMQHFDHSRPVKRQRGVPCAASAKLLEGSPLGIRQRRRDEIAVVDARCRYKAPARYDEEIIVRTHLKNIRESVIHFGYELVRASDGVILAEGETTHIVADAKMRKTAIPEKYMKAFRTAAGK